MEEIIRIQTQVATGRLTLPVAVVVCLSLWSAGFGGWDELAGLGILALTGYVMIEANTAFTLIRTRTSLPVCVYGLLVSSMCFLHPFQWSDLFPPAFLLAVTQLFRSYESPRPATPVYNAFLIIGTCSLFFPPAVWFIPLFTVSLVPFRSFSLKSVCACLLGLATPYWFLFGYTFWNGQTERFIRPLKEMLTFAPLSYAHLSSAEAVSWAVTTGFLLVSAIHYGYVSYTDRTRTRIFHTFLAYAGGWTTVMTLLMPRYLDALLPVQCICAAFLGGRLFTLTRNRFSGIFFVVIFASIILLTVYNLWMHFFNS